MDDPLQSARVAAIIAETTSAPNVSRAGRNSSHFVRSSIRAPAALSQQELLNEKVASLKRKTQAVVPAGDGGEDDGKARGFGRGRIVDDGTRDELCSSPRLHPEEERRRGHTYEETRLLVFDRILEGASRLALHDEGAIEDELANKPLPGVPRVGTEAAPLPTVEPIALTARSVSKAAEVSPAPSTARKPALPQACMLTTERWREGQAEVLPPVGHYHPKHRAVETNPHVGGFIAPSNKSNLAAAKERRERQRKKLAKDANAQMQAVMASSKLLRFIGRKIGEKPSPPLISADARTSTQAALLPSEPASPRPDADKEKRKVHIGIGTSAFASKVPTAAQMIPKLKSPDEWYWPRNDGATDHRVPVIDMSKTSPRPPLAPDTVGPEARYVPSFIDKTGANSPDFAKYSPRKGVAKEALNQPILDLENERLKRQVYKQELKTVDFEKILPRISVFEEAKASARHGVSVDEAPIVAVLASPRGGARPAADFSKALSRPSPRKAADHDPLMNVNFDSVAPVVRQAQIRADAVGHGDLFDKKPSHAIYDPVIAAIRPKLTQNIEFAKATPRKYAPAQMADLQYETDPATGREGSRVRGDPMMQRQLSRDRREELLAAKSVTTQLDYNPKPPGLVNPGGYTDMGRQVDRYHVFKGRSMGSDAFRERELKGIPAKPKKT